ncbi:hypothetical protein X943_002991 [Babesia divergens]|uniref:Uncharacterized protein n=1 Tax=Babesia divergens TaxID=32595 RepID=A0AAD9LI48_BABDI|nr:hypothetical protein X943_002991 [Babesia divergens]
MHILTSHNVLENAVISKLSVNQEGELINAQVGEGVRAADGIGNHCSGGSDESEFLELRADDRTTLHATETTRDIQQSKWKRLTGLKKIETRHLALIHRAYAHSTFLNKKLMDTIFETMIQLEKRFQPIEIVMVVNSMARSKMHNKQLVNLFSKRILKDYKRFTLDMLSVFLNGICMPNDNDRDFFDRILSLIIRKFNGQIDAKHALTLIQVKLPVGENSRILCQQLLNEHDVLDPLELTNAVAYLSKLYPNLAEIRHLVDMYLEIYDENDEIRNPQQLAILYYALSRLHDPPYDECRHRILNLIERSNFDHFDPIHVANILRAMSLHSIYQESLVNRFAVYIEDNMKRFSFQLLGSSLDSLCDLNYSGNTLWLKLCKLGMLDILCLSVF